MEPTNEQLQQLKQIELEMLRFFIDICNKENLLYFTVGGTALGAMRHKGFIPWDDDIDVAMPREDYEKFMAVANKYLPEYYFLQNSFTDKNCPFNFAKIRDSRTTFIEASCQNIKMNHGVYIDIFPLDGYPSQRLRQKMFDIADLVLKIRISFIFTKKRTNRLRSRIGTFILKTAIPDYRTAVRLRDRLLKKYKYSSSELIFNCCGAWGKKEMMPKSYFNSGKQGKFEELDVILPENSDKYLTSLYGDYMTLPPIEKRVCHHYTTVVDLDNPYTKYI